MLLKVAGEPIDKCIRETTGGNQRDAKTERVDQLEKFCTTFSLAKLL